MIHEKLKKGKKREEKKAKTRKIKNRKAQLGHDKYLFEACPTGCYPMR